jgi:2-keto-3-deoxy-L-rhamnonate aldolase RhmA
MDFSECFARLDPVHHRHTSTGGPAAERSSGTGTGRPPVRHGYWRLNAKSEILPRLQRVARARPDFSFCAILQGSEAMLSAQEEAMTVRRMGLLAAVCVMAVLMVAWPQAQQAPGAAPAAQAPATAAPTIPLWVPDAGRPIGYRVRQEMDNPSAKLYNAAKQKLLNGQQVFGWTETRPDPAEYCEMARHFDFIWIEMQHGTLSYADVEKMIAACPRVGVPIIRIPIGSENEIQQATDIGALGIVVPTVDDAIEARDAGRFGKFPPFGRRSGGAGQAGSIYGVGGINYRQTINDNFLVIVMLETPQAADNAYEIAAQPGVDVVIVGNSDLASFSGYPQTDVRYQDLVVKIHNGALKAGKFFGCASNTCAQGLVYSKDAQLFQSGPAHDGFKPPARGAAAAPPAGAPPAGATPAAPPVR